MLSICLQLTFVIVCFLLCNVNRFIYCWSILSPTLHFLFTNPLPVASSLYSPSFFSYSFFSYSVHFHCFHFLPDCSIFLSHNDFLFQFYLFPPIFQLPISHLFSNYLYHCTAMLWTAIHCIYCTVLYYSLIICRVDEDSQGEALGALNGIKVSHYKHILTQTHTHCHTHL